MYRLLYDPDPNPPDGAGTTGGSEKRKLVVNGTEREFTLDEIIERAQKAEAADEKFREAADLRKTIEAEKEKLAKALQLEKDMELLKTNDEGAFRRVAPQLGWTQDQIEEAILANRQAEIRAAMGGDAGDADPTLSAKPKRSTDRSGGGGTDVDIQSAVEAAIAKALPTIQGKMQLGVEQMEPRMQRALLNVINQAIEKNLVRGVDSDPLLSKIKKLGSDDQKSALDDLVKQEAMRRAAAGEDLTDVDQLHAALQSVRQHLTKLGVKPANEPQSTGLGSSSTSGFGIHLSEKPVDRPQSGMEDGNYAQYIVDRLQREAASSPGE